MANNNIEMISITKAEHEELLKARTFLSALESAGVDNWEGYEAAVAIQESME